MWILVRALTYGTLFVGFLLLFVPARLLSWSRTVPTPPSAPWRAGGVALATLGAAVVVWCVASFVTIGKGTPAPFDPPRRLVVRGPYRFVRNPMYVGAILLISGAAVDRRSPVLAGYAALFWLVVHLFVVTYEEPTLRRKFGDEYIEYARRVRRWRPRLHGTGGG